MLNYFDRLKNLNYINCFQNFELIESITYTVTSHGSFIIAFITLKILKLYVFQIVAIF